MRLGLEELRRNGHVTRDIAVSTVAPTIAAGIANSAAPTRLMIAVVMVALHTAFRWDAVNHLGQRVLGGP